MIRWTFMVGALLVAWCVAMVAQQNPARASKVDPPVTASSVEAQAAPEPVALVATNYASSSLEELQKSVPELRRLKPSDDQSNLSVILDKVGERTLDLSQRMPNLISDEEVVQSELGTKTRRDKFSYLILARRGADAITLEEFRVDLKMGSSLETDESWKSESPLVSTSRWADLARASEQVSTRANGGPPLSEGFASMWLRFYPTNRREASFRYLGEQEIDGRPTLVLAFAEKPGSVRLPAEIRFNDRDVPVYYQGIAWVNAADYTILRLRTDLLSKFTDLPLSQLTAEVSFASTHAAGFPDPLWLPREVEITSEVSGHAYHDKHSYSNYRSFQAHARILVP